MPSDPIYCRGDADLFPASEFRKDSQGQTIRPYIHENPLPHYATNGEPFTYSDVPGPLARENRDASVTEGAD